MTITTRDDIELAQLLAGMTGGRATPSDVAPMRPRRSHRPFGARGRRRLDRPSRLRSPQAANSRLAALAAAAAAVADASVDAADLLNRLAGAAAAAMGRTHAELRVVADGGDIAGLGLAGVAAEQARLGPPVGALPAGWRATATRAPVEQRLDDPRLPIRVARVLAKAGKRRMLIVPLLAGEDIVGSLQLWTPNDERPFTPDDLLLAAAIGRQLGATIHNARLRAAAHRRAREQEGLLRVSRAAASSLELRTVLAEIARASLGVAGAECCGISLWHRETDELEIGAEETVPDWPGVDPPGTRYPLGEWPAMRAVLGGADPACHQQGTAALGEAEHAVLAAHGILSCLMAPVRVGSECLGLVNFYSRRPRAFQPDDVRVARDIAAQVALAMQNARLLEDARRHADEQKALLRVTQAVISDRVLPDILAEVARASLGIAGAEACEIDLLHPSLEATEVIAEAYPADWPGAPGGGNRHPLADRPMALRAVEARAPITFTVASPEVTEAERRGYAEYGIGGVLVVPLLLGAECLGLLNLFTLRSHAFGVDAIRFGQDLAGQAAQAIDRARLHAALRERADTDGLTGLLNHRSIVGALDEELAKARAADSPVAVLLVDIDDFKLFNDTHGHQIGDQVLCETSTVLREAISKTARVGRYGGDEFLVVVPGLDKAEARDAATAVLRRAATMTTNVDGMQLPLKLSVGVAVYPTAGHSRQELIGAADAAMYAAKEAGGGLIGVEGRATRWLEQSPFGPLMGLVRAVDRRDRYTRRHSDLVTVVAVHFALGLGLPPEDIEALEIAGPLHDVGKIVVPDAILRKPGALTAEEFAVIRQHVTYGELMVQGVPHQSAVQAAIAHHHERWDGSGYPRGRRGEEIPLLGRVLALADAYAAMVHDRPYRKGLPIDEVIAAIRAGAGTQFDPVLTEPFIVTLTGLKIEAPPATVSPAVAMPTGVLIPEPGPLALHVAD